MARQIYVNLPIRDMQRTKAFFGKMGFEFEPKFSNEQGACMVVGEDIFVMLLTEPFFKGFTSKAIADATKTTEVLVCLSCDSRAEVDRLAADAKRAGARWHKEAKDHGFMYEHGFEDLDGHLWELVYMDPDAKMPG